MGFTQTVANAIIAAAADAVIASDSEGIIRVWNPGAERIFGYTEVEAIGQSLDIITPERLRKRHWDGYGMATEKPWQRARAATERARSCPFLVSARMAGKSP
jgi:PAS domain S-box-containing protein